MPKIMFTLLDILGFLLMQLKTQLLILSKFNPSNVGKNPNYNLIKLKRKKMMTDICYLPYINPLLVRDSKKDIPLVWLLIGKHLILFNLKLLRMGLVNGRSKNQWKKDLKLFIKILRCMQKKLI